MENRTDFIGFTYNKKHSLRDLHIYRVNDGGNRYTTNLIPTLTDKTIDVPGGDGQYLFNTYYKNRVFSVNIAFDSLSEAGLRLLRNTFNGKEVAELIFDECPYKAYDAKVTGSPQLKLLCFDKRNEYGNTERVYKGEGTIQFTCYNPYAHTPAWVWSINDQGQFAAITADGRIWDNYSIEAYPNKSEWDAIGTDLWKSYIEEDGLKGELPAPFVVEVQLPDSGKYAISSHVGGGSYKTHIIFEYNGDQEVTITWNSKTGLVQAGGAQKQILPVTGDVCYQIPLGILPVFQCRKIDEEGNEIIRIHEVYPKYNFWYY